MTIWIYLSEILIKKIQNLIRASIHMIKIVLPILFCRCHLFFTWTTFSSFLYHFFSTFFFTVKIILKNVTEAKTDIKKRKKNQKDLRICFSVYPSSKSFILVFFPSSVKVERVCFSSVCCKWNHKVICFIFVFFFLIHFCYQTLVCWKFLNFIFFLFSQLTDDKKR